MRWELLRQKIIRLGSWVQFYLVFSKSSKGDLRYSPVAAGWGLRTFPRTTRTWMKRCIQTRHQKMWYGNTSTTTGPHTHKQEFLAPSTNTSTNHHLLLLPPPPMVRSWSTRHGSARSKMLISPPHLEWKLQSPCPAFTSKFPVPSDNYNLYTSSKLV